MKTALPPRPLWPTLATACALFVSLQLAGAEFESESGDISGSLDTTLSYGAMWRVESRDDAIYRGDTSPTHDDVNTNDGNRAFDKGLVSQVFKLTAELEVNVRDQYGLYVRGNAFYDTVLMDRGNHWASANQSSVNGGYPDQAGTYPYGNGWADSVLNGQGKEAEILDAYVFAEASLGGKSDMPVDIRLGKQVINWGEGLFYRDGINTVNALDGASFVLPGAEIKDLLIPQAALSFNVGVTDNLSMSVYYQFDWEATVTPGRGTFFSNNDLFTDGATAGYNEIPDSLELVSGMYALGNGGVSYYGDMGIVTAGDYLKVADTSGSEDAGDNGQWGFSFKYLAEALNDTEFGFYFVNYNSHTPYIEAQLDRSTIADGMALAGSKTTELANALGQTVPGAGVTLEQLLSSQGACSDTATCTQYLLGQSAGAYVLSNGVSAYRVYPEDIQMFGVSFNTAVGHTSIGGELAFRPNAPIWIDHPNDLIDGLNQNMGSIVQGQDCFSNLSQAQPDDVYCLSGGAYKNYREVRLWTGSLVFIHNFGPGFGMDGFYGIFSPAFEYLDGLDQYDNYASTASGAWGESFQSNYRPESDRLDRLSWGYTAVASGEINDAFAGINLNPVVSFRQDVRGNSRTTGNFLEGRNAITLALNAVYLNRIEGGLSYTSFFGAERTNKNADRDNIAFTIKYSF